MSSPDLTVVVPAYNAERTLSECVDSLLLADHEGECEVILVDDGSSDSTAEICDGYARAHAHVRAIHHENGGLPSARNRGFAEGSGKWVWFVDSDDVVSPKAVSLILDACATGPDLIALGVCIFEDGGCPSWAGEDSDDGPLTMSGLDFLRGIWERRRQNYIPQFVYRRSSLLSLKGPFLEEFSLYEDVAFTQRYLVDIDVVSVIAAPLYGYRQSVSSMTHHRNSGAARSGLRVVRSLEGLFVSDEYRDERVSAEIDLLLYAYGLVERGAESSSLRSEIRTEVESRVNSIGAKCLSTKNFVKYLLLKAGLLGCVLFARDAIGGSDV